MRWKRVRFRARDGNGGIHVIWRDYMWNEQVPDPIWINGVPYWREKTVEVRMWRGGSVTA